MTETLELEELAICYEDSGVRAGRPLLMLHGFTGHRDDFEGVRDVLAARRRVLTPDLRGHGNSGRANAIESYGFETVLGDLSGLLDQLGVEDVDLLGHSMGGMIALRMALTCPERVHSLIAMNTTPEATVGMKADGLVKASRLALKEGMGVLEEVSRRVSERSPDPLLKHWAERYWSHRRRRFLAMDPLAYAGFAEAMATSRSLTDELSQIEAPALVLVGEFDHDFLPGAERLQSGLGRARQVTIPSAGHHPHEENRGAWLAAIEEHFTVVEG
ncbi:MAG: alpha/beta fold hydrolase [Myxococcota bacterium]|nr:alpha/beta fold hydrolase [Myxococcota bacterium]